MIQNNSYNVKLKVDVKKQFLDSCVHLEYYFKNSNQDEVIFYIHNGLEIKNIQCDSLINYEVEQDVGEWNPFILEAKRIKLYLNRKFSEGENIEIIFNYSGHINELRDNGVNRISESWVELGIYSPWFPLTEEFEQALFKVEISMEPKDYIVLGSNSKRKLEENWIIEQTVPFIDCSFIASKEFNKNYFTEKINNIDIGIYYINEEHKEIAEMFSERVFFTLNNFNDFFGGITQCQYSIVILPRDSGGGYNRPGLIVLPDLINDKDKHFKYKEGEIGHFKYLAHEMAHLWWSKAQCTTWEDWLNESFAEYSCLMAIREYYGEEEFNKLIKEYEEKCTNLPQIKGLDRGHEKAFDSLYVKGPVLLYNLEKEIGKEKFKSLLKNIHTHKVNNTEDFLEELLELTDEETVEKFNEKLES